MNKKIISIGIVAIFLLAVLSAASSAIGTKAEKIEKVKSDGEIDLQLTVKNLHGRWIRKFLWFKEWIGYSATVYIKNIGTMSLEMSDYPDLEVRYTAEYEGEEVCNYTFNAWGQGEIDLEPGEDIGWTIVFRDMEYPYDYAPPGSTLKVVVDPNNLIPETDDYDNNYWSEVGPLSVNPVNLFTYLLNKLSNNY